MSKAKIIHIHTDLKFVDISNIFEGEEFENIVIIIGKENEYSGFYKGSAIFYELSLRSIRSIIRKCNAADLVVIYNLNKAHSKIAHKIDKNIPIAWRFFGTEYYSRFPDIYLSNITQTALKESFLRNYYRSIMLIKDSVLYFLKWRSFSESDFKKAVLRINLFICICEEEFDIIKDKWFHLPEFISTPIRKNLAALKNDKKSSHLIILGNNGSSFNNHLDIIKIIERNKNCHYSFILPVSYGGSKPYINYLKDYTRKMSNIEFLENFIDYTKYEAMYNNVAAAVFNSYRQMAVGNIFLALRNDVKVYLNPANPIYKWLINNDIVVFSTNSLENDISENRAYLQNIEIKKNRIMLDKLSEANSIDKFQQKIIFFLKR